MANTVRDLGAEASSTIGMLEFTVRTTVWLRYDLESIITYQDPAKSLGELYEAVDQPRAEPTFTTLWSRRQYASSIFPRT